ncbi:divalent metal ion transporter [Corynebacterium striatum]|nr:Nramp family divalent metal transporter [Corynebacterium striatum]QQE53384.1 Nramp family divalent metal transporter [Corynebacterium striatum]STD61923.1 divalent metal ion transporter [Corynebacterium striatum]
MSTPASSSPPASGHMDVPKWKVIGPGLVAAATGVGSGDLVATLIAGQKYGFALLWACIAGTIMKIVLVEGVGRYTLATGNTMFHGWSSLGKWTSWYFAPYIIIWGFVYGAAAMSATGMALHALIPQVPLVAWAVISGLIGFGLTWAGQYRMFEKTIAVLVGIMFLTVVGIACLSLSNIGEILKGLVPTLPEGSFVYVLSLAGGVGGTITLAAYGYWLHEKGWDSPPWMRVMRLDNTVAYVVTGIFVAAMLIIGGDLLYSANIAVSKGDKGLIDLADVLRDRYGSFMAPVFLIGFWAAALSSVLGVWNGVSMMFADYVGHIKKLPQEHPDTQMGGKYYRWFVLWLTFPPMLLLFLGKPTALVIAYGVLGAFFMPFLGLTLLILLNTRHTPREWRNGWFVNTLMAIISAAFVYICVNELIKIFVGG